MIVIEDKTRNSAKNCRVSFISETGSGIKFRVVMKVCMHVFRWFRAVWRESGREIK